MSNRNFKLNMERLETREMMAGDIAAFVSGGHLYVAEASGEHGQGQAAAVSQPGDTRLSTRVGFEV